MTVKLSEIKHLVELCRDRDFTYQAWREVENIARKIARESSRETGRVMAWLEKISGEAWIVCDIDNEIALDSCGRWIAGDRFVGARHVDDLYHCGMCDDYYLSGDGRVTRDGFEWYCHDHACGYDRAREEDAAEEEEYGTSNHGRDYLAPHSVNPVTALPRANVFLRAPGENIQRDKHGRDSTLYLGLELEVIARKSIAVALDELKPAARNMVFKPDGSLPDGGFEIVTPPATLRAMKAMLDQQFFALTPHKFLAAYRYRSCGTHVHLSRAALSPLTLGKMLVFMNAADNRRFIEFVAGRSQNDFCKYIPKKWRDALRDPPDRYQALNLDTGTKPTVEMRIFKGNISRAAVFRALEFAESCARFCEDASASKLTHKGFISYIESTQFTYPFLAAHIARDYSIALKKTNPIINLTQNEDAA